MGASGDLSQRKLIPALYNLAAVNLLPPRGLIVGFARTDLDEQTASASWRAAPIQQYSRTGFDETVWAELVPRLTYVRHDAGRLRRAEGHSPREASGWSTWRSRPPRYPDRSTACSDADLATAPASSSRSRSGTTWRRPAS